jgi:hypothetical protein
MGRDARAGRGSVAVAEVAPADVAAVAAVAGVALACVALLLALVMAQPVEAAEAVHAAEAVQAAQLPSSHLKNGVCLVSGVPSIARGTASLVVAPHPTGLKILWLPGFNTITCTITTTHAGASIAAALARAITHAPAVANNAEFSCPEDDGTRASLSFTYAHHRSAPPIVVDLGGCRFISQSGREQRSTTAGVSDRLAPLAPCGWRTYFADPIGAC